MKTRHMTNMDQKIDPPSNIVMLRNSFVATTKNKKYVEINSKSFGKKLNNNLQLNKVKE